MRTALLGFLVAIVALAAPTSLLAQTDAAPRFQVKAPAAQPVAKATTKPPGKAAVAKPVAKAATKPPGKAAVAKPAAVTAEKPAAQPAKVIVVRGSQQAKPATAPVTTKAVAGRPAQVAARPGPRAGRYGAAVPAAIAASPYAPPLEKLPPPADDGAPRTLTLFNMNTQETISATYKRGGRYLPAELQRLSTFLVDHKSGDVIAMDPELFDILWHLQRRLGASSFEVLSAYRSPQTNAVLARMSRGVARNSLHTIGQAIDVKVPGFSPYQVREAARELGLGGVGYYPRTGFVHIDTGSVRYW